MLALLAPMLQAHAQTSQGGGAAARTRILSIGAPPLADEQLPEGGLVLALVNASLDRAGKAGRSDVRWTTGALTREALNDPRTDFFLPVESADCDHPNELSHDSAVVCDHAIYSDPILRVVLALFTLTNSPFKFDKDDAILGKTVCLSREQDLTALNSRGRNWAAYKRVTVLRRASLLDCIVAVQAKDADALIAVDLEGKFMLRRLGLTPYFAMQARPIATLGVHAVVSRTHERAAELIGSLNRGLQLLKESDAYAAIVQRHLMPSSATAAAAIRAPAAPELPRPPAQGPLPATAAAAASAPAAVPVLEGAVRQTALKFLKRGDEELSEGRVAPARLLYERAADMGLAQAAMALAGTYDATELNQPHLRNIVPDAAEAKRWYERARALGAAEAGAKLQRLGSK